MFQLRLLAPLFLAALTTSPISAPPARGPERIAQMLRGFLAAVDKGDAAAAVACLDQTPRFPALVYHVDEHDRAVTLRDAPAIKQWIEGHIQRVKDSEAQLSTQVTAIHADCHSPELGFATLELTQTLTRKDGSRSTLPYRATVLVSWSKETEWRFFHWHDSRSGARVDVKAQDAPAKEAAGKKGDRK